jgi:hypothetical protein
MGKKIKYEGKSVNIEAISPEQLQIESERIKAHEIWNEVLDLQRRVKELPPLLNNSPAKTTRDWTGPTIRDLERTLVKLNTMWGKIRNKIREDYVELVYIPMPEDRKCPESELILGILYFQKWFKTFRLWDRWRYRRTDYAKKKRLDCDDKNRAKIRIQTRSRQTKFRRRQNALAFKGALLSGEPVQEQFLKALSKLRELDPDEASRIAQGTDLTSLDKSKVNDSLMQSPILESSSIDLADALLDENVYQLAKSRFR